jgi:pimeloyl-ACP methyl ester carboxylesterase
MRGLGYGRYGAQGTDFGAGVATFMALDEPESMIGIHLNNLEISPHIGPDSRPLTANEKTYLERNDAWWQAEGGYKAIQSTKPQTLGYGLNDSPAGLAAWILEKWRSWADSHGDLEGRFSRDFLLTILTIYGPHRRSHHRSGITTIIGGSESVVGRRNFVHLPTGVAVFANQFVDDGTPPREWAERLYNVRQWTLMPSGGHFAAAEEPKRLAHDIVNFFAHSCT